MKNELRHLKIRQNGIGKVGACVRNFVGCDLLGIKSKANGFAFAFCTKISITCFKASFKGFRSYL